MRTLALALALALVLTACEGPAGPPGADGLDGADGNNGEDGSNGEDGDTGAAGTSGRLGAYRWVDATGVIVSEDASLTWFDSNELAWGIDVKTGRPHTVDTPVSIFMDDSCLIPAGYTIFSPRYPSILDGVVYAIPDAGIVPACPGSVLSDEECVPLVDPSANLCESFAPLSEFDSFGAPPSFPTFGVPPFHPEQISGR